MILKHRALAPLQGGPDSYREGARYRDWWQKDGVWWNKRRYLGGKTD